MHSELARLHEHAVRVSQAARAGQLAPADALNRLRKAVVTDACGVSWVVLPVAGVLVLHNIANGREPLEAHHSTFASAPKPAFASWQARRLTQRHPCRLYAKAALLLALFSVAVVRLAPSDSSDSAAVAEVSVVALSVACVGVCSNGDRAITLPARADTRMQAPQTRCFEVLGGVGSLVSAVATGGGVLCHVKSCETLVSSVTDGGGAVCARSRSQS